MTEQSESVDVVEYDQHQLAEQQVLMPTTPALQKMAAEAAAMDTAFKMAQSLSKTNAVPQRYQQSYVPKGESEPQGIRAAYDLAAAIMYGAELEMSALQSAQNVFPVHGQPSVYARTMVAQVRKWIDRRVAEGRTSADPDVGDSIWEVSASPEKVVWAARRDGKTAASEWTPQRAETAGFTSNDKYRKQPTEMLRAKAMTEVCRILFQDVLLGMAYSVEELQLSETVSVQVVRPPTKQKGTAGLQSMLEQRKASRAAAEPHPAEPGPADQSTDQQPVPEPEVIVDPEPEPAPAPKPATKRQIADVKRLLASVEKLTDPTHPDTLLLVSALVDHEVTDLDTLSAADAAMAISELSKTPNNKEN